MKVFFDVAEYYYLPQYEPVISELATRNNQAYLLVDKTKSEYFTGVDIKSMCVDEILYYNSPEHKEQIILIELLIIKAVLCMT